MNPNDVLSQMPRIGEKRMETPTIMDGIETAKPQKCVVVEVSAKGLWYRVRFIETGRCECYKISKLKRRNEKR